MNRHIKRKMHIAIHNPNATKEELLGIIIDFYGELAVAESKIDSLQRLVDEYKKQFPFPR